MAIEPSSVDWDTARRVSYRVRQSFRYEYPEPIRDLSHRLIVIPPERFGDQRRLWHDLSVGLQGTEVENLTDRYGNMVVNVFAPRVSDAIEFVVRDTLKRLADLVEHAEVALALLLELIQALQVPSRDERCDGDARLLDHHATLGHIAEPLRPEQVYVHRQTVLRNGA